MLPRLILLFVVVPLVELFLLLELAQLTGAMPTFALVIVTGVVGSVLARSQGVRTLYRIQESLQAGKSPGEPLIDGGLILVAGAFLLTPGILTDVIGFLLLIPWTRTLIRAMVKRRIHAKFKVFTTNAPHPFESDVVDGQVHSSDPAGADSSPSQAVPESPLLPPKPPPAE